MSDFFEKLLELLVWLMASPILSGIAGYLGSYWQQNNQRKKQNRYNDAKEILPILLELLEDLGILEEVFVFKGAFCPSFEHRLPTLSNVDGDGSSSMSFAQRVYKFNTIASRIVRNCRKVMYLVPIQTLPGVINICVNIIEFFCTKDSQDSHTEWELARIDLLNYMTDPKNELIDNRLNVFLRGIQRFYQELDEAITNDLPKLNQ
jgi:hypothetical protein